jgi:hypothetical protein
MGDDAGQMLYEAQPDVFGAECEDCKGRSHAIEGSRELAIVRLMRGGWRTRREDGRILTWCPTCWTPASVR